jgi:hypothetical protein
MGRLPRCSEQVRATLLVVGQETMRFSKLLRHGLSTKRARICAVVVLSVYVFFNFFIWFYHSGGLIVILKVRFPTDMSEKAGQFAGIHFR